MNFNEKLPQFWRILTFKNMLKLKTVTERGDNGNRYFDNTFSFSNEFRSVRPYFITQWDGGLQQCDGGLKQWDGGLHLWDDW